MRPAADDIVFAVVDEHGDIRVFSRLNHVTAHLKYRDLGGVHISARKMTEIDRISARAFLGKGKDDALADELAEKFGDESYFRQAIKRRRKK